MRTVLTFQTSAFNVSEAKDHFINPGCYGDDLAKWLIARLRQAGITTDDEPGQEDFGWYFTFSVPEGDHSCVLGYRPGDEADPGTWIGWLERDCGFVMSLLGGRNRGIAPSAIVAVHRALSGASEITQLRWHAKADFDGGREERGVESP